MSDFVHWVEAIGTIGVAATAVFGETIRGWFYHPKFLVTARTEQPDASMTTITNAQTGEKITDAIYLRLWVENVGNAAAKNVEVYAQTLRRQRADGQWEMYETFPPMNLRWSNVPFLVYPVISPKMGKHCDCVHIVDPVKRAESGMSDDNPGLQLAASVASMTIDLIATPNHRGNIVPPGEYELLIKVGATNSGTSDWLVTLRFDGMWTSDAAQMTSNHVGIRRVREV